jgi:hypothetical protein
MASKLQWSENRSRLRAPTRAWEATAPPPPA